MNISHKYRDKQAGKTYTAREYAQEHARNYCCNSHAIGAYCDKAGQAYRDNDTALGAFYLAVAVEMTEMDNGQGYADFMAESLAGTGGRA